MSDTSDEFEISNDQRVWPRDLRPPFRTEYEPRGGGGVVQVLAQMINEEAPCDACPQKKHCNDFALACSDYLLYVNTGALRCRRRAPTRQIYMKIYPR